MKTRLWLLNVFGDVRAKVRLIYSSYRKANFKMINDIGIFSSTITTWGKDGEIEAFQNMLTRFPTGLMACVSDSYNIWNACEKVSSMKE